MIAKKTLKQAWSLLPKAERRKAFGVLALILATGLSSALRIGVFLPFFSVLLEVDAIETNRWLNWAYTYFEFPGRFEFVLALGIVTIAVTVMASLIQIAQIYAIAKFTTMQVHTLSRTLLRVYLSQPYSFFFNVHSGDLSKTIIAESGQVVGKFIRPATEAIASAFTILFVTILLFVVEPWVALSVIGVFGSAYVGLLLLTNSTLKIWGERRVQANGLRFKYAGEALNGVKDLRIRGSEAEYLRRYEAPSHDVAFSQVVLNTISAIPSSLIQMIAMSGIVVLCLLMIEGDGANFSIASLVPILVVFGLAAQRMMPEFSRLYASITSLQYSGPAVESVWQAANLPLVADITTPIKDEDRIGLGTAINLDQVRYAYPNTTQSSLDKISFAINRGETIGIVGETGAGKSTLADLLLGLILPDEGQFSVDDTCIDAKNVRRWQRSVGHVPQDVFMADASVTENIALGDRPEIIDRDKVIASAKAAKLDDVIRALPRGYDTPCGERGIRFSGGQKQRIGIARALYDDVDLIVFDEATSALDTVTEREVMDAIRDLSSKATLVIIAHRLSTVRDCDRILVLDRGEVAGFDSWDNLMATNETFKGLANAAES